MSNEEYIPVEYADGPYPRAYCLYYKCLSCGQIIPSMPVDSIGCLCGNIFIDVDYFRLSVNDQSAFRVVEKICRVQSGVPGEIQEQVRQSLGRLLERCGEGTCVIIEDTKTEKFVQFAGVESEGLIFDLPREAMSDKELARAKKVLPTMGIVFGKRDLYDKPDGEVVGRWSGFSLDLGSDIESATNAVMLVFEKVYCIELPWSLKIMEY